MKDWPELPPRDEVRQNFIRAVAQSLIDSPASKVTGQGKVAPRAEKPEDFAEEKLAPGVSAPQVIRTAICFEPREGRLHVFMPPFRRRKIISTSFLHRGHGRGAGNAGHHRRRNAAV